MNQQLQLQCAECGYQEAGASHKMLMNKIILWNHVKKAHPRTADRIMRTCQMMPADLYQNYSAPSVRAFART